MAKSEEHVYPFTLDDLREYEFENGTRLFAELWETCSIDELQKHASKLDGLGLSIPTNTSFDPSALLSFSYLGFEFFVTAAQGEFMLYVTQPQAPDEILMTIATHFNERLRKTFRGPTSFVAYGAKTINIDRKKDP